MKKPSSHWATVLDIIEAGLNRDAEKARNYSALLADRLEATGEPLVAARIRRALALQQPPKLENHRPSAALTPAHLASGPVDPESRSALVDELLPQEEEPLVLDPEAAAEVRRFIELQRHSDQFLAQEIAVPRTLLLYGPPGVGKSVTARQIAHELDLPLSVVRLDAVISSYLGTTAKNLRTVFEHAARRGGILFLDEFDALAKMRDDTNEVGELKRIVNSLIQNIDSFPGLYVIAATNHEQLLDPAIWRRFDVVIGLASPGLEERAVLLRAFLNHEQMDEQVVRSIAMIADGCTGADLEQVVLRARQERILLSADTLAPLLVREIWRRQERSAVRVRRAADEKADLIRFIDARTSGRLTARTLEDLTGVSDSTIARIRRTEGEAAAHGR